MKLTKSKFMAGLKCNRYLWFSDRKQLPEISLSDKHKFSQGHDFEKYVYELFPTGVDLSGLDFVENLEKTQEAMERINPIFEAGIQCEDYFVRVDILNPSEKGNWNLIEIKSTTEVKKHHIPDLAFQKFVCEKAGLKIDRCSVFYLDKHYVKEGLVDAKKLVTQEDVTEQVELVEDVEKNAQASLAIIKKDDVPPITISPNCNKPHECPLKKDCWGTLPENNVLHLTNWRTYWKLFNEGIEDLKDIPPGTKLCDKDEIIKESVETQKSFISKEHIKHFLQSLHYPLNHFDFETFDTAVPIYDKSKPYQKIPFQFSLHIQQEDGTVTHKEFLAEGTEDPRPALIKAMRESIPDQGDLIVYHKSFEEGRIKELAEDFPEHKEWLLTLLSRIVDLIVPFRSFYYYNPKQKGSASIKKVLPAVTGKGYDKLEIGNGGDASMLYFYSHIKSKPELNKEEIRINLIKYCGLDTEGMVWIINELRGIVDE